MTEIIGRLRVDGGSKIEWEAADEIEDLRRQVVLLTGLLSRIRHTCHYTDAAWALDAIRDILEEAP